MTITVDENILIAAGVGVFIPLFIFFVKLIIKFQELNSKLAQLCEHINENKKSTKDLIEMQGDVREIFFRLDNIERSISNNSSYHRGGSPLDTRDRDRDNRDNDNSSRRDGFNRK